MSGRGLLVAAGTVLFALAALAAAALAWLWHRPGFWSALAASLALCWLVTVPWAFIAALTIGPAAWPPRSYTQLLAGPSGTPGQFAEVNGGLVAGCFLLSGWRRRRRGRG